MPRGEARDSSGPSVPGIFRSVWSAWVNATEAWVNATERLQVAVPPEYSILHTEPRPPVARAGKSRWRVRLFLPVACLAARCLAPADRMSTTRPRKHQIFRRLILGPPSVNGGRRTRVLRPLVHLHPNAPFLDVLPGPWADARRPAERVTPGVVAVFSILEPPRLRGRSDRPALGSNYPRTEGDQAISRCCVPGYSEVAASESRRP